MIYLRHSIYPCKSLFIPMEQKVNSKSGWRNSCCRWAKYMSQTHSESLFTLPFQLPMGSKCPLPQEICQLVCLVFPIVLVIESKDSIAYPSCSGRIFFLTNWLQHKFCLQPSSLMEHLFKLRHFGVFALQYMKFVILTFNHFKISTPIFLMRVD